MNKTQLDKAIKLLEEAYKNISKEQKQFNSKMYIPVRSVQQHIGGAISYLQEVKKNEKIEQKQAITKLFKIIFAREMTGIVELPAHNGGPRFHSCWHGEARLTIVDMLSDERDQLLKELGLEQSPIKP